MTMKIALSCVSVLLLVAIVNCRVPLRPSNFGAVYSVSGDTKRTVCHPGGCHLQSYQTQYFQNLHRATAIRMDTNKWNYHENIYYVRIPGIHGLTIKEYRYTPSTWPPSCKSRHVQHIPILGVTPDYQYRGRQHVEGKLCDKWQSVIHYGGRNPPRGSAPGTITKTWFVFFNTGVRPPRHEPVKYVYYNSGTQSTKTSIRKEDMWRGYHPNVPNHYHILPKECHGK